MVAKAVGEEGERGARAEDLVRAAVVEDAQLQQAVDRDAVGEVVQVEEAHARREALNAGRLHRLHKLMYCPGLR